MSWVRVATSEEIPDERTLRVEIGGHPVCLARSEGELFAVDDTCTHADVSLSEGEVEDCRVECWLHGSQFDLRTGEPTCLPATVPVATYAVRIDPDGAVYVDTDERPDHAAQPDTAHKHGAAAAREN